MSSLGSAVVPSPLDAVSHGPAGRWVLLRSGTTVMGLPADGPGARRQLQNMNIRILYIKFIENIKAFKDL